MSRKDIARRVAEKEGLKQETAARAVNETIEAIASGLCEGQRIEIRGLGTFSVVHRPPRVFINPRTRQPVPKIDTYRVKFKPSRGLNRRVDEAQSRAVSLPLGHYDPAISDKNRQAKF